MNVKCFVITHFRKALIPCWTNTRPPGNATALVLNERMDEHESYWFLTSEVINKDKVGCL